MSTNAAMSLDELVFVFERRLMPEVSIRVRWRDLDLLINLFILKRNNCDLR